MCVLLFHEGEKLIGLVDVYNFQTLIKTKEKVIWLTSSKQEAGSKLQPKTYNTSKLFFELRGVISISSRTSPRHPAAPCSWTPPKNMAGFLGERWGKEPRWTKDWKEPAVVFVTIQKISKHRQLYTTQLLSPKNPNDFLLIPEKNTLIKQDFCLIAHFPHSQPTILKQTHLLFHSQAMPWDEHHKHALTDN